MKVTWWRTQAHKRIKDEKLNEKKNTIASKSCKFFSLCFRRLWYLFGSAIIELAVVKHNANEPHFKTVHRQSFYWTCFFESISRGFSEKIAWTDYLNLARSLKSLSILSWKTFESRLTCKSSFLFSVHAVFLVFQSKNKHFPFW